MYRVAILQNESEMLRSGFTNVISKLQTIRGLSHYSFELFNCVNISKLFTDNEIHLSNYDSLFITTNATSDISVLNYLQQNKGVIDTFIKSGKGIFIASQKKLSTTNFTEGGSSGGTGFLPDLYEFYTVERPKAEKDSGMGSISFAEDKPGIILQYPKSVTAEMINERCKENEFKRHFYRSHIVPKSSGSYLPVLADISYEMPKPRNLLMINLVPQHAERIVLSTIALDWEFHENLLINILTYITEGLPKVAFIDRSAVKHGDFDFLLTSARLSKIPHVLYQLVEHITPELTKVHNTYIFSPDWEEREVNDFLKTVAINQRNNPEEKKGYIRIYYFKKIEDTLTLAQYSNFSTIDLIIDSAVLWVNSRYSNGMWNKSFWTTYDVLVMFKELDIDISTYLVPLLKDLKNHYADFSYDGVTGATCGLLELLIFIEHNYPEELEKENLSKTDIKGMFNWLLEKFESQSAFDKQTVFLTFNKYRGIFFGDTSTYRFDESIFENIREKVSQSVIERSGNHADYPEIDICRDMSVYWALDNNNTGKIKELLLVLKATQAASGKWTNIGRTAHTLLFLLSNYESLKALTNENEVHLDGMIYNSVLFLRGEYNWRNANWDNDLQATAKATQAIGLYNMQFKYSTQDFFKTLEIESDKIYSATVIHNVSESMRKIRHQSNEMIKMIEKLKEEAKEKITLINEQGEKIVANEHYEKEIGNQIIKTRAIATVFGTLFISFTFYLALKYPSRVLQEFSKIDITGIVLGGIVGIILTGIVQKTIGKVDILKKIRKKRTN